MALESFYFFKGLKKFQSNYAGILIYALAVIPAHFFSDLMRWLNISDL